MKSLRILFIFLAPLLFVACMTPQKATKQGANLPAYELCKRYYYSASGAAYNSEAISKAYGDVAASRGINCEVYLSAIQNERAVESANAAAIFGASVGLLGASQPTYVAPQQVAPTQCRVIRGAYGDRMYCN